MEGGFGILPCRVICPGGAEVVRRMASHNFRGSHDEIQIKIQSLHSLGRTNDPQIEASLAIRTFKDLDAARQQARPYSGDATDARRRDGCRYYDGNRMAAAFGSWFSCRRGSQEARLESCFRIDGQGASLPNQG